MKYIKELSEKYPLWIVVKWDKKLKFAINSKSSNGRNDEKTLIIRGKPAIVKIKEAAIDMINAIIWLFVSEEKKIPKDTYPPAINIQPT